MITTAVQVQCVHKVRVRTATSRQQHIYARRNNTGGFLPRASLFPHMPTATFRSTARLFDVASVWHAVYHVFQCLPVTCARHTPKTYTKYWYVQIIFVLLFLLSLSKIVFLYFLVRFSQNHVFVFLKFFRQFPERNKFPELRYLEKHKVGVGFGSKS